MDIGFGRFWILIFFLEVFKSFKVEIGVLMGIVLFEMNGVWDIVIICSDRKKY